MKIYRKSLWKTPLFWQILFIILASIYAIRKESEFLNILLPIGFIGLWSVLKTLWYIGFDDIGMYRFHCLHKGLVDQYKYEDIETVYVIKNLWATNLMIKTKNGERKNCSLALMDKKDIPILLEELKQHSVDVD